MIAKKFGERGCSKSNMAVEAFKDERDDLIDKCKLKGDKEIIDMWLDNKPDDISSYLSHKELNEMLYKSIDSLKFNKASYWTDSIPKVDNPKSPGMQADSSDESGDL